MVVAFVNGSIITNQLWKMQQREKYDKTKGK